MSEPAIAVEGLVKRFGERTVVDHVSMTVEKGEIMGFLGPNGSGKTTTIRVMCGLLTPDEGSGTVLGYDLLDETGRIRREVGYMTQRFSFYEDLSIAENLAFVAGLYGLKPVRRAVDRTLEQLGLTARRHQLAGRLSGGWKQRLALAACTMHRPRLLLLDEPTAGVDPQARRAFWDEIHHLAADGITVLVSTHYMDEAERCHRINYIAYGKLVASGTVEEVVRDAGLHTFVIDRLDPAAAARLARALHDAAGVEQIAPFGATLHVVGRDRDKLEASVRAAAEKAGGRVQPAETSLEDTFIRLMNQSKDNMG